MFTMWVMYAFRNLLSALIWKDRSTDLAPATFTVTQRERLAIAGELALIISILVCVIALLSFNFLPNWMLHVHFSYHAEHHIFPGLNSDYFPLARELLRQYYGDRMEYLVTGAEAWRMLLSTPRQYLDNRTLSSRGGEQQARCYLIFDVERAPLLSE
jgi:fatty acid desaturase